MSAPCKPLSTSYVQSSSTLTSRWRRPNSISRTQERLKRKEHNFSRKTLLCAADLDARANILSRLSDKAKLPTEILMETDASSEQPPSSSSPSPYLTETMQQYEVLKSETRRLCLQQGGAVVLYSLLTSSVDSGLSAAAGAGGGLLYLIMLQNYVDSIGDPKVWVTPLPDKFTSRVQPWQREKVNIAGNPFQMMTKPLHPFRQALGHPRLLVLVGLAAAGCAVNYSHANLGTPLQAEFGFMLFGFLSYKFAFLTYIYKTDVVEGIDSMVKGAYKE